MCNNGCAHRFILTIGSRNKHYKRQCRAAWGREQSGQRKMALWDVNKLQAVARGGGYQRSGNDGEQDDSRACVSPDEIRNAYGVKEWAPWHVSQNTYVHVPYKLTQGNLRCNRTYLVSINMPRSDLSEIISDTHFRCLMAALCDYVATILPRFDACGGGCVANSHISARLEEREPLRDAFPARCLAPVRDTLVRHFRLRQGSNKISG